MSTDNFWKFPPDSKIDVLNEQSRAHGPYIFGAISADTTGVEEIGDSEYILFDAKGEEALLWRPKVLVYKLAMLVFSGFIKVVTHD